MTAPHLPETHVNADVQPTGGAAVAAQPTSSSTDATPTDPHKHPVDERLPALKMATSGLQHVAAMYAGVVAPP